ncbi:MAG TPA: hypothetical protein VGV61_17975, partial [Thermoanaerobaculia bacterium]|nr:hypothetical protein [Thermoanaerobaculia bacterium]
ATAALGTAVTDWGGEWTSHGTSGDLRLPVRAGLRHGLLRGRATATGAVGGCELAVEIVEAEWELQRSAVMLLLTAAVTGLAGVLWPFFPPLAPLVPLGLVLGASAWLVILARLENRGPAELLVDVEAALEAAPEGKPSP